MEQASFVEFQQRRDFSGLLNATMAFIKQEYKPLVKAMLIYVGPPLLLLVIVQSFFVAEISNIMNSPFGIDSNFFGEMAVFNIAQYILIGVVLLLLSVVVYGYVVEYIEFGSQVPFDRVKVRVKQLFGSFLGIEILIGLVMVMVAVVGVALLVTVFLIPISFILFGLGFYFWIAFSLAFIINAWEGKSIGESLGRSRRLIQNNWWMTFGCLLVVGLIVMALGYAVSLPSQIIVMVDMFHSIDQMAGASPGFQFSPLATGAMIVGNIIGSVSYFFYAIPMIFLSFHYFNLVEKKEAKSLMDRIEMIGKNDEDQNEDKGQI